MFTPDTRFLRLLLFRIYFKVSYKVLIRVWMNSIRNLISQSAVSNVPILCVALRRTHLLLHYNTSHENLIVLEFLNATLLATNLSLPPSLTRTHTHTPRQPTAFLKCRTVTACGLRIRRFL